MRWLSPLLASFALSCAAPRPEAALNAYAEALGAQEAAEVHARSDASTRAAHPPAAVAARLAEDPKAVEALARSLRGVALELRAEGRTPQGRRVVLVLEQGAWRVARGGLTLAGYGTPEAALRTLIAAARAGRLEDARGAIPEAFVSRYAEDAALEAHLGRIRGRLEAAAEALGPEFEGRAEIDGERARLAYGEGRSVRFVRETGRWRVLDVE